MTLGDKQRLFSRLVAALLNFAWSLGYEIKFDDAYRSPRAYFPYCLGKSCHKKRLAIDLCLFKDKKYLTETEDYKPLGIYWESLHPFCRWGGKFKNIKGGDGCHFSMEHEGVK